MYQRKQDAGRTQAQTENTTKYEALFLHIDIIVEEGRKIVFGLNLHNNDRQGIARALLLIRMLNHLESISRLCELGYETEAMILHRSMVEALLRVAGLTRSPDISDDYWGQYLLQRQGMYQDLKTFLCAGIAGVPVTPADVQLKLDEVNTQISEWEKRQGRPLKPISANKWAQLGNTEDLFYLRYRLGSLPVHHAPQDLARHVVEGEDGWIKNLLAGPENHDIESLLRDSADIAAMALSVTANGLGMELSDELAATAAAFRNMYK